MKPEQIAKILVSSLIENPTLNFEEIVKLILRDKHISVIDFNLFLTVYGLEAKKLMHIEDDGTLHLINK
jgi:hypothetical protein